jgi:hypothetical protein
MVRLSENFDLFREDGTRHVKTSNSMMERTWRNQEMVEPETDPTLDKISANRR